MQQKAEASEVSTREFENRIEKATSAGELRKILEELPKITFSAKMEQLREAYGMTFSQIQLRSGITKSLFYALLNGTRTPKKVHILKIAFAMGLSLGETNALLKLGKLKELYAKNKEDAIVMYGLLNRLDCAQVEQLLSDSGAQLHLME